MSNEGFKDGTLLVVKPECLEELDCPTMRNGFRNGEIACIRVEGDYDNFPNICHYDVLDRDMKRIGGYCCAVREEHFIEYTGGLMNRIKLNETQKKNLSPEAQALVEAGYYTADLRVASESHFIKFLQSKFEPDYAAQAKAELEADDAAQAEVNGKKKATK